MSKISVILPTYNYGKYLSTSLDSILNQTHQDIELIIVDDGSTDDTQQVASNYQDRFPNKVYYFYQTNQGPAAARNYGINQASGKFIAFLDSDDVWVSNKLEKQLALFKQNPDMGIVFCDLTKKYKEKISKEKCFLKEKGYYPYIYGNDIFTNLISHMFIFTSTVMIKKEVIQTIGMFNEQYHVGEDWDLWLRILNKYNAGFVPEALVLRQVHGDNISGNMFKYCENLIRLKLSYLESTLFDKQQKVLLKKQLHKHYFDFGYEFYSHKEHLKSIPWFLKNFLAEFEWKSLFYAVIALIPPSILENLRKG